MFILILMLQALHLIHVEVAVVGHFDRCHHSLQRNVTIRSRQIFARRVRYSYSPWIDYIDNNYVHVIYSHLLLLLLLKRKNVVKILIMMSCTYCQPGPTVIHDDTVSIYVAMGFCVGINTCY